jgi:hypothetical protein
MQNFAQHVKNLTEVITALHVLAVVIVNVTRTPKVFLEPGCPQDLFHVGIVLLSYWRVLLLHLLSVNNLLT